VSVEETGESAAPYPPKQDPETLVLRGRPRPVVRFKRGVIIAGAAIGSVSLVAVAWFALEPPSFRFAAGQEDQGEPARKTPSDALANAPSSYGDVPKLGPPLPGDLGRPILDDERGLAQAESGETMAQPVPAEGAGSAAEEDRRRLASERKAVREAGVLVQLGAQTAHAAEAAPAVERGAATTPAAAAGSSEAAVGRDPNNQQRKLAFTRSETADVNPHALTAAPSPWMLAAGSIIPASLVTGLNSDLPGMVIAQVTENVFDSVTGRSVLIPQGARLIGSYDSVVAFGQRRALLVWQRILFPDGSSLRLDNVPASDLSGYAGLEDKVDSHTWRMLRGVALSTLLGVGSQLSFGSGESDLVRALRESTQQNAAHAGDQITARNLDVQPTIKVRPGWPVRAVIHKDLVLKPWRG
jgi:type IV secretory pathway VirB10-like protein